MNSFTPQVTITELCDEVVARDRLNRKQVDTAYESLDASLEHQKNAYENRIDNMSCDIEDLEKDLEASDAKLQDQYEDNKFLDDEIYSLNADIKDATRDMEVLMADFEVINIHEVDTFADWAERAYRAMRDISNGFPVISYVGNYDALEDASFDIRDEDVDYDDYEAYNPADWNDGWRIDTEDNTVEAANYTEAE
jgi:hypothetical protein